MLLLLTLPLGYEPLFLPPKTDPEFRMRKSMNVISSQAVFLARSLILFLAHPLQSATMWGRSRLGHDALSLLCPLGLGYDASQFLSAVMRKDSEEIFFRGELLLCQIEEIKAKISGHSEGPLLRPWILFTFQAMIQHGMRTMEIERSASLMVRCFNETGATSLDGIPGFDARIAQMFLSAYRAKRMLVDQTPQLPSDPLSRLLTSPRAKRSPSQDKKPSLGKTPQSPLGRLPTIRSQKDSYADIIPFPYKH